MRHKALLYFPQEKLLEVQENSKLGCSDSLGLHLVVLQPSMNIEEKRTPHRRKEAQTGLIRETVVPSNDLMRKPKFQIRPPD